MGSYTPGTEAWPPSHHVQVVPAEPAIGSQQHNFVDGNVGFQEHFPFVPAQEQHETQHQHNFHHSLTPAEAPAFSHTIAHQHQHISNPPDAQHHIQQASYDGHELRQTFPTHEPPVGFDHFAANGPTSASTNGTDNYGGGELQHIIENGAWSLPGSSGEQGNDAMPHHATRPDVHYDEHGHEVNGAASNNPATWREFSSVLTQPLDVSNLMLPEFPADSQGHSTSSSGSFSFGLGPEAQHAARPDPNHGQLSHDAQHTPFAEASHLRGVPGVHMGEMGPGAIGHDAKSMDAHRPEGSLQYNAPSHHGPPPSWSHAPQSPSIGPSRNGPMPHRMHDSFAAPGFPPHHSQHPMSGPGRDMQRSADLDYTDYRLSAALANNAHISVGGPSDLHVRHLQPSVSTPTIKEEDEGPFRFHMGAYPHARQSLPGPLHMPHRDFGYQDRGHEGASVSAIRRAAPSVRPSVFQQLQNFDRRVFEERDISHVEDCLTFIDDVMGNYLATPSRLGLGERSVVIMTSRVAQKSYGAEKRFLCPPPMVLLVGSSWWSACQENSSDEHHKEPTVLTPPRLSISMGGDDSIVQDSVLEWASSNGKLLDTDNPSSDFAISGRSIGRQLFINDSDDKRKFCEALVHINVPTRSPTERRALGTFSSKPIKIISKPSKKRQSTRNTELGVLHGSTISLFHRLRSQTVSTRYLCVSGAPTWFKGSDGEPFLNTDSNTHIPNQGEPPSCFVAKTSSWDPFIVYLVDPSISASDGADKQQQAQSPTMRPSQYPPPPFNALPLGSSLQAIHYNQPVVLQCLNTAVVSPVMVIRKVERGTSVIGGGQVPGSSGNNAAEAYGDPVSQLHKIALEVIDDPSTAAPMADAFRDGNTPGQSGHFLGCLNENVGLRKPSALRQWCNIISRPSTPTTPLTPMIMQNAISQSGDHSVDFKGEPLSPTAMTAAYAAAQSRFNTSQRLAMSPTSATSSSRSGPSIVWDDDVSEEGSVKRPRRVSSSVLVSQEKRGQNRRRGQSLSVVGLQNQKQQQQAAQAQYQSRAGQGGPMPPPSSAGSSLYTSSSSADHLRRASSFATSTGGSESSTAITAPPPSSLWSVDVHDSDIWTVVGVDIARHTFYLPPKLVGGAKGDAKSVDSSIAHLVNVPAPCKPITPLPSLASFKPARNGSQVLIGRRRGASESSVSSTGMPGSANAATLGAAAASSAAAHKTGADLATLIGENLSTDLFVYFGDWRSTHVLAPSSTTIMCAPPPSTDETGLPRGKVPITLVRRDGVIFPTSCIYPT